ncbi:hypothetical protein [Pseudoalteromonas spongiae]|uniref:Uncharacterized protein n=1 Tax=Pseudoalteromonas spongiae TaxID=298657 RepID=A0ABU8EXJ6_9GAMM
MINITDPKWLAEREQLWLDKILPRLTYDTGYKFPKRQLQQLKRYYLTGIPPKLSETSQFDPFPLVISLWLHPDQSLENWLGILAKAQADFFGSYFLDHHLKNSLCFFGEAGSYITIPNLELDPSGNTYYYHIEEGYFLGAEKALLDFFFSHMGDERYITYKSNKDEFVFDKYQSFGLYHFPSSTRGWLQAETLINPYFSNRYKTKYWLLSLETKDEYYYDEYDFRDMYGKTYTSVSPKNEMISFFYTLLHYPELGIKSDDSIRCQYVADTIKAIEEFELPDFIDHWWQIVKTSKTLEQAQERAKPRFKEKEIPIVKEKTMKEKLLERRATPKKKRRGKLV